MGNNEHNLVQLENTKEYREKFIEEDNSENKFENTNEVNLDEDIIDLNEFENKLVKLKSTDKTEQVKSNGDTLNNKVLQLEQTEDPEKENFNKMKSEEEMETALSIVSSSSNLSEAIK